MDMYAICIACNEMAYGVDDEVVVGYEPREGVVEAVNGLVKYLRGLTNQADVLVYASDSDGEILYVGGVKEDTIET